MKILKSKMPLGLILMIGLVLLLPDFEPTARLSGFDSSFEATGAVPSEIAVDSATTPTARAESKIGARRHPPVVHQPSNARENRPRAWYPELDRIAELEDLPPSTALVELFPLLSAADPVVRLAALEALAAMDHSARESMLAAALADPLAQIRIAALEALSIPGQDSARSYVEASLFDTDSGVKVAAIEALGMLESKQSIHALAGLLFDPDLRVRRHTVNAIGEIGGEEAFSYLQALIYDPDRSVRASARAILRELDLNSEY